jgi:hypothetical protein
MRKGSIMKSLEDRYRFFRKHAGGIVGRAAECAFALTKAEEKAEAVGLTVVWEWETDFPWDGEGPAPAYWLCGLVFRAEDVDKREGTYRHGARSYACLGGVGVDSMRSPYLRVVGAELFAQALDEIDKEWQAEANELAARATFAGVAS